MGVGAKAKSVTMPINYTVRVMGQALFICLGTRRLSSYADIDLFYVSPGAEILLRRRPGEKFKNSEGSDLQAL